MEFDIAKHLRREPQIYQNIELHPIILADFEIYDIFLELMCIPKDYIPVKEVLKMSYLKYVLFFMQGYANFYNPESINNNVSYEKKMEILLSYITKKDVKITQIIDAVFLDDVQFHYEICIGKDKFYEYDFDLMREIILEQNGENLEYIESFNPELEGSLNFFRKKGKSISLINRIFIYSTISNTNIPDILNWTITEFKKKEEIIKIYEEWKIYKPLEASGQVEFKPPSVLDNPFEYDDKVSSRYASILMNMDDFNRGLKEFSK